MTIAGEHEQITLFELAGLANQEHRLAIQSGEAMVLHAQKAGAALLEAKARIPHGGWLSWLRDNFEASERTASDYMRIANSQRAADLNEGSIRSALEAVRDRQGDDHVLSLMGSSASDNWPTPQDLFDELDAEFHFDVDVCALAENAKCETFFDVEADGLAQVWKGTCWMNPPYGAEIGKWIAKAHEAGDSGATVVCLVPARVDTAWFWDHCRYAEVRFLRGRLRNPNGVSWPFPSVLVIFGRPERVLWWKR